MPQFVLALQHCKDQSMPLYQAGSGIVAFLSVNGMQNLSSLLQLCHRLAWYGITARIILKGERFFLFGSALATLSGWLMHCCILPFTKDVCVLHAMGTKK